MKYEEALEKAKAVAFKDYDDETHDADNGYNATRVWERSDHNSCSIYALSGTPPKAYVVVVPKTKKILCQRTVNSEPFAVIEFEDEVKASPSTQEDFE